MRIQPYKLPIFNRQISQQHPQEHPTPLLNIQNADTVHFSAKITDKYPKTFLKELMQYGLPCPICGKEMIPLELMNRPATESLQLISDKFEQMSPIGQVMFHQLKQLSKKYPKKNIQELLQTQFKKSEINLIVEQREILDSLNFLSWQLPNKKGIELRKIIGRAFESIFKREPNPKKRFKRKKSLQVLTTLQTH